MQPIIVNEGRRQAAVAHLRQRGVTLPTWSELAEPGLSRTDVPTELSQVDPDAADPTNLWRVHWFNDAARTRPRGRSRPPRAASGADRRQSADRRDARPPLPDDRRAQGAGCLRLSRAAPGDRTLRSDGATAPSGRRRAITAAAASPSRAFSAAAALPCCRPGMSRERFDWLERWVTRSGGHRPHARHREQRQGDLRQVRRARARPGQRHRQPVLRVRQLPDSLPLHRAARSTASFAHMRRPIRDYRLAAFVSATGSAGTIAAGDYLKAAHGTQHRRGRGDRMPDDARATATASTTSRASATSTSRSSTT